jgi:hypothetical protein
VGEVSAVVTYAREDAERVEFQAFLSDLEKCREDIWRDIATPGGQEWWDEILDHIRECTLYVFIISDRSVASPYCLSELDWATALRRPILPVMITPVAEFSLPRELTTKQVISYVKRGESADSAVECITALRNTLECLKDRGAPPLPDPVPSLRQSRATSATSCGHISPDPN